MALVGRFASTKDHCQAIQIGRANDGVQKGRPHICDLVWSLRDGRRLDIELEGPGLQKPFSPLIGQLWQNVHPGNGGTKGQGPGKASSAEARRPISYDACESFETEAF